MVCNVIGSHLFHATNQENAPNILWAVLRCFPALIGVLASTFDWLIGWLVASALQSYMRNAYGRKSSLLRIHIGVRVDLMLPSVNTGFDLLTYERREMEKAFG